MTVIGPNLDTILYSGIALIITIVIFIAYLKRRGHREDGIDVYVPPFIVVIGIFSIVMLSGFTGFPHPPIEDWTTTGTIDDIDTTSPSNVTINFGIFSGSDISQTDFKFILQETEYYEGETVLNIPYNENNTMVDMESSSSTVSAVFTNGNPSTDILGPGDSIDITGLIPGKEYKFVVFHILTDSVVFIGQNTFIMPSS